MSYYDFSRTSPVARRQRSKIGLLAVAIIATLVWGGMRLLWSHKAQPSTPIAQINVVSLPEIEQTPVIQKETKPKAASALQFHQLVEPSQQNNSRAAPTVGHNVYTLQVATSTSGIAAEGLVQKLKSHHFPAKLISSSSGDKKQWNQVVIGPFTHNQEAYVAQKKLQKLGFRGVLLISK